jgi:hypothetical protein
LRTWHFTPRRRGQCRAAKALSPLLGCGDADLVYVTYGKIWFRCSVMFAFGILGRRLASESAVADLPAAESSAR